MLKLMRAVLSCPGKNDEREGFVRSSMAGIVTVTVYAQVWSLFGPVSLAAFAVLCVCSLICLFLFRKNMRREITEAIMAFRAKTGSLSRVLWILILVVTVLAMALFTARGYMHYDSDLYHAQAIHWIEQYGSVKGLANLHCRLGYNSAAFALTALYSFAFAGGQSLHTVQGYLALLLLWESLKIFKKTGKPQDRSKPVNVAPSDFVRLAALFYLFAVSDEIVSPASDYFLVCVSFYVIIRFLDSLDDWYAMSLLSVLAVYAMTIKLSAACLMLLAVLPGYLLIRKNEWKRLWILIGSGFLTTLPFLLRNIILTGYLVYPFPSVDLFSVPWKVPGDVARADATEIKVWGRGLTDVRLADAPLKTWVGGWFQALAKTDQLFLLLDILAGLLLVMLLYRLVRKKLTVSKRLVFVLLVLLVSTVFWFVSAPLIRYGCVFVYSFAALGAGIVWKAAAARCSESVQKCAARIFLLGTLLFVLYKSAATVREQQRYQLSHLNSQQDYGTYEVETYEMNGVTFYYPAEGDRCGYAPFPSSQENRTGQMQMVTNDLADGFYPAQDMIR